MSLKSFKVTLSEQNGENGGEVTHEDGTEVPLTPREQPDDDDENKEAEGITSIKVSHKAVKADGKDYKVGWQSCSGNNY